MCLSGKKIDFRKKLYCCHYKSDMAARLLLVDEQKSGKARSKLREQDRYIHIQCAAWNPYVDTSHLPFSTTLPKIKSDWAICHFCNARYGFQIHCAHIENGEPCNISFHPMCALRHGFLDPPPVYNAKFTTCYCPKHVGDESTFTPTDSRLRTATSHDEELAIQLTRRRTLPNYTSGSRRNWRFV
ncbi:Protein Jade-1 [Coemansia sp. RSA 2322]|nr:Protein Jade-1 [Coemansia sp. RSA 2322]